MIIGLPKEIKKEEYRIALTPSSAKEYIDNGHSVIVETKAGAGVGFTDEDYIEKGCTIEADVKKLFDAADMIVKVKEPLEEEYDLFHEGQILFTYLHLAANRKLTQALLDKKIYSFAYETLTESDGSLPLLIPMSQIAGRMSIQEGAKYLEKTFGGRGILLGGVPGIERGRVVIIGGGAAGTNACKIAVGMGADVTIMDVSAKRLGELDDIFGSSITTLFSTPANIEKALKAADLVVGAVLIPGAAAPKLITREHLKIMKEGSVLVDIAVDQGGCAETTKPTYHTDPVFIIDGVVHYCVANMPGAVALSSTLALTSVTNRYGINIANFGVKKAVKGTKELPTALSFIENLNRVVKNSKQLRTALNTYEGKLTNKAVAETFDMEYVEVWKNS